MVTIKLLVRIMDTDNGGIEWGDPIALEIEAPGDDDEDLPIQEIAARINRAQALAIGIEDPEPGLVTRAAGDEYNGIAWIDDLGHQGATSLILEWHAA